MCMFSKKEVDDLLVKHEGLVRHIVSKKFNIMPYSSQYEDCLQEGRAAMWRAIEEFDEAHGKSLVSFMSGFIYNQVYHYLVKDNAVSVSYRQLYRYNELNKRIKAGETLTPAEQDEYNSIASARFGHVDYDDAVGSAVTDETEYRRLDLWDAVEKYIHSITNANEQAYVRMYIDGIKGGDAPKLSGIAETFGVSRQHVSAIIKKHMDNMQGVVKE